MALLMVVLHNFCFKLGQRRKEPVINEPRWLEEEARSGQQVNDTDLPPHPQARPTNVWYLPTPSLEASRSPRSAQPRASPPRARIRDLRKSDNIWAKIAP